MAKKKEDQVAYVDAKGKRLDGRKIDELRPIKIKAGVIPRADGSAYLEWRQRPCFAPPQDMPNHPLLGLPRP